MIIRQVDPSKNKNSSTAIQVNDLIQNEELPFHKELTINALDSNFSSPEYIVDTYENPNLVNIIRLASNRNVWKKLSRDETLERKRKNKSNQGAYAIYGQKYSLSVVESWELPPNSERVFGIKLSNGKCCEVKVKLWEDILIRTKRKKDMKDKAFRLANIELLNPENGKQLFGRSMWLGVWGKRNSELTEKDIYFCYRNRFDIEHFFRFGKQRLLLSSYQSPDNEHLQNWLHVVILAYWMLWVAKDEAEYKCPKWQMYDKNMKKRIKNNSPPTPSQVLWQMESILLSFDHSPFIPKPRNKGLGRRKDTVFDKRTKYPVLKKQHSSS